MKIVAIVDRQGPDANAAYLVDYVTEGAMTMSTNLITLHYLNKLPLFVDISEKERNSLDTPNDDFSEIEKEIIDAELLIIGADVDNDESCRLLDRMFKRICASYKPLKLEGKKVVFATVANKDNDEAHAKVGKYLSRLSERKMEIADTLYFFDDNGRISVKENSDIKKEAQQIGLKFRNTIRSSLSKKTQ